MRSVFALSFLLSVVVLGKSQSPRVPYVIKKEDSAMYVASYNIYLFGAIAKKYQFAKGENDQNVMPRRTLNNADVLSKGGFDLICIQGIREGIHGKWALEDLVLVLNEKYQYRYKFRQSNSIGRGYRYNECIGFLYDSVTVTPLKGDGVVKVEGGMTMIKTKWASGDLDFTLISSQFNHGNLGARKKEYLRLNEVINDPLRYSDDPDVLVMGDLSRFAGKGKIVKQIPFDTSQFFSPNVQMFDPAFNQMPFVTTASIEGKGIPHNDPDLLSTTCSVRREVFDVILATEDLAEEYYKSNKRTHEFNKDFGVLSFDNAKGVGHVNGAQRYGEDIRRDFSNHRPIWIRLYTNSKTMDRQLPSFD